MSSQLANIAIAALQPRLVADFWCQVLGWQVLEEEDGVITVGRPDGTWPVIDVLPSPEPKQAQNRLHLDLRADGTSTAEELERLLSLGARRVDVGQGPDVSWEVLCDPEGNEFCLLSRTVGEVSGGTGPPLP